MPDQDYLEITGPNGGPTNMATDPIPVTEMITYLTLDTGDGSGGPPPPAPGRPAAAGTAVGPSQGAGRVGRRLPGVRLERVADCGIARRGETTPMRGEFGLFSLPLPGRLPAWLGLDRGCSGRALARAESGPAPAPGCSPFPPPSSAVPWRPLLR